MSLQDEFRQERPSEEELIQTEQRIAAEGGNDSLRSECPTLTHWTFFVAGRYNEARVSLLKEHLAKCDTCAAALARIHAQQQTARQRASSIQKLVFATAVAAVLVVALVAAWIFYNRVPSKTALVDLRNITRGIDSSANSGVVLHRGSQHLHVLLAPQPAEGQYEIGIFKLVDRNSPVLLKPASPTQESDSLLLDASFVLTDLQPGPYLLGIRQNHSEWVYYPIRIE